MPDLDSQAKSIQSLWSWYTNETLIVNRKYQRKLVWTRSEQQQLIDSILKGFPIPAIILATDSSEKSEIIDGLQRLHTIFAFIDNQVTTIDGRYFPINEFPNARNYLSSNPRYVAPPTDATLLTSAEVTRFLDYSLPLSIIRNADTSEIQDIFTRINTYGHQLSDQERRQAGTTDAFSSLVRTIACTLRGDTSQEIITLNDMPSISINPPRTDFKYGVRADETFWVRQGILNSNELRESMDEQCLADILACTVSSHLISRDKAALDAVYAKDSVENFNMLNALSTYGSERIAEEVKYCIDQLESASAKSGKTLKRLLTSNTNNNSFPATYAATIIALFEILITEERKISDFSGLTSALEGLSKKIDTSRGAGPSQKRRSNIDAIKGLIRPHTVEADISHIYDNPGAADIDSVIRQAAIEMAHYEFKQGLLRLDETRSIDDHTPRRVVETICGMANLGLHTPCAIIIGVADKEKDVERIERLDGITSRKVGAHSVVGVAREAKVLEQDPEMYVRRWRQAIANSGLSSNLKQDVLERLRYQDYFGLGVLMITVPPQNQPSFLDGKMFTRSADQTEEVDDAERIAKITARFPNSRS